MMQDFFSNADFEVEDTKEVRDETLNRRRGLDDEFLYNFVYTMSFFYQHRDRPDWLYVPREFARGEQISANFERMPTTTFRFVR